MTPQITDPVWQWEWGRQLLPDRFLSKIKVYWPTGCWLWMACCNDEGGHGQYKDKGKVVLAHRYAYERVFGPIPEGLVLRHVRCHCANCVNPWHMTPGTHEENVADRMRDGTTARGERNGRAKLNEAAVLDILASQGQVSLAELARRYGVTPRAVRFILQGKNWAHLTAQT